MSELTYSDVLLRTEASMRTLRAEPRVLAAILARKLNVEALGAAGAGRVYGAGRPNDTKN